jgi:hypothetical protein
MDMALTAPPLQESPRKERLVEFLMAFLGMSVFDLADVWVPLAGKAALRHVVTVTANNGLPISTTLAQFKRTSETTLIPYWTGAVGRAFSTGNPVWSSNEAVFMDTGRAGAFQETKFHTVLAVPVFSKSVTSQPACVVAAYAFVKSGSIPFVLRFVQQALRLLWDDGGLEDVCAVHEQQQEAATPGVAWQNVATPADLGEMAADVEMQQHFAARKRTHEIMTTTATTTEQQQQQDLACSQEDSYWTPVTNSLSAQLSSIELPNGDVINIPLQYYNEQENSPEDNELMCDYGMGISISIIFQQ